jgi:hypothetical protein
MTQDVNREEIMSKLHKIELYILDVNENFEGSQNVLNYIEHQTSRYLNIKPASQKSVDIEWDDDIDLNFSNCPLENYEAYFIREEERIKIKQVTAYAQEVIDYTNEWFNSESGKIWVAEMMDKMELLEEIK